MARRRIGQEWLNVHVGQSPHGASLNEISVLIDWEFCHTVSDPGRVGPTRRGTGRRRSAQASPHRRRTRRTGGSWSDHRALRKLHIRQIMPRGEHKGVAVRTGTLADATLIASASIQHDAEARWAGHRRRKPLHGYKAHIATDQDAALIRGVEITTANVHDAAELEAVLPPQPGDVYGDSAYASSRSERIIAARGGRARTVQTGVWGGAEALARVQAHNVEVHAVRARIEKVFGTCKRSYGLSRMRWLGLAKAGLQVRLTVIAYNLRRSWRLLTPLLPA